MSKNRFTTSDVKAMVRDIRSSILGQRVANIYDLSDKIYLFKFAIPGVAKKIFLLVESGMRFHTTKYTRDKNDMPSPFAMKLRKHIRLKRLEDIRQLGSDRVVDLKFGSGDAICHIILELYASGNIVLTDGNYEILALLRSHKFEEDIAVQVGEIYPIAFTTTVLPSDNTSTNSTISNMSTTEFIKWTRERYQDMIQQNEEQQKLKKEADNATVSTTSDAKGKKGRGNATTAAAGSKKVRMKKMNMRQLLLCKESGVALYGPEILDHCLLTSGFTPSAKVEDFLKSYDESSDRRNEFGDVTLLQSELRDSAPELLALLDSPGQPGYILMKEPSPTTPDDDNKEKGKSGIYFDFVPRMYKQHQGNAFIELSSFDAAVDEYFCKVEEQRLQQQANTAEETAKKKVNKVKVEMERQLQGLADTQLKMETSASLTEAFAEEVDKACLVINSALSAGISWEDISTMVAAETAAGNPIASMIVKLKLDKNRVVIRLPNILADSDDDDSDDDLFSDSSSRQDMSEKARKEFVEVELDLSMSAYANASKLYTQRKVARTKEQKTAVAAERAIKAAELSSSKQLVKQQVKRNLQAQRKVHWFEKFNWFISSEGYLVLSGRDAQQNEQLVKKYLRSGDAYVHADMHGASSCIVRCKVEKDPLTGSETPLPISPFALNEAGTMTICRSGAWSAKVVMSAWWVQASQVSKTAPTGEYLTTGSFMIYGKKNYLPPSTLEMGFGILFRLDDGSVSRHLADRTDRVVAMKEVNDDFVVESRIDLKQIVEKSKNKGDDNVLHTVDQENKKQKKTRAQRKAEKSMIKNVDGDNCTDNNDDDYDDDDGGGNGVEINDIVLKTTGDNDSVENEKVLDIADSILDESDCNVDGIEHNSTISDVSEANDDAKDLPKNDEKLSDDQSAKKTGKARLTPYQRKMLKKGKTLEEIEQILAEKKKEKEFEEQQATLKTDEQENNSSDKEESVDNSGESMSLGNTKKKKLNKKKARRYADQDEEDVRLAMLALGHVDKSGKQNDVVTAASKKSAEEKSIKQAKAGIHLLQEDWKTAIEGLSTTVQQQLKILVDKKVIKEGELDTFELTTLGTFTPDEGIEILALFDCEKCASIGNKSGFLAGIMRRYSKNKKESSNERQKLIASNDVKVDSLDNKDEDNTGTTEGISRRERKKIEAKEIQMILQEEGMLDEQEGRLADELEKLTGAPLPEDVVLYAVPVCGPFTALKNLKYKVKLTPGTIKKGKACKNAVEVFVSSKNYSDAGVAKGTVTEDAATQLEALNKERTLIKGLTDPEMVAIMIGDVKLSMPGLYDTLKKKKAAAKKGKKK